MIDYAQWKAAHPDAGSSEIEEKIIALSGQMARANAAQESYPKKPGF